MDTPAVPVNPKLDLIVHRHDLTITARELAVHISASGTMFDRAGPVRVSPGHPASVSKLTPHATVNLAHQLVHPIEEKKGERKFVTLPDRVAHLYLALDGEWGLLPLHGVTTAPLISPDGTIRGAEGYDLKTGLWCSKLPSLAVPAMPSQREASDALARIRAAFKTFPFADAATVSADEFNSVDIASPARLDESCLITALLTAICRSSLPLVPGLLISAPSLSGAGTGKGLLVRSICAIAYGLQPHAFTVGPDIAELDKRIAAALLDAEQIIFIDNANCRALRSDLLASVMTEPQVRIRPLGTSISRRITPNAFLAITGNGITLSEDLARRFIVVQLDARTEDPEQRPFQPGFLNGIMDRREELLTAALTIWRWGRQNDQTIERGRPFGSYELWCRWVRDPLLALGCADPIDRLQRIKADDPTRRLTSELFDTWSTQHGSTPVAASQLSEEVRDLLDPQRKGRQFVATALPRLVGTRAGGFVLTCQKPIGKHGAATYALHRVGSGAANAMG